MLNQRSPVQRRALKGIFQSFTALIFSLIVGAITIALSGYSPLQTYGMIFEGSLGSMNGFLLAMREATPLMFTGLAFAVTFRVGIINIGAEGQVMIGGLAAALVGAYVTVLPGLSHLASSLVVGAVAGGLVGLFTGYLKVRFGAQEAITCIMLNSIIALLVNYLCNGPLKPEGASNPQTKRILESARLGKIVPASQLTYGILIIIAISILFYFIQTRTVWGYKMQVVGLNRLAGEVAGIKSSFVYLVTFFMSGAIAGLAGADITLGVLGRNVDPITSGYGFAGISVAALAAYHPIGVIFSSLLFGILKAGALQVNRTTSIPFEFVDVIQVVVVIAITAPRIVTFIPDSIARLISKLKKTESVKENSASSPTRRSDR